MVGFCETERITRRLLKAAIKSGLPAWANSYANKQISRARFRYDRARLLKSSPEKKHHISRAISDLLATWDVFHEFFSRDSS